MVQLTRIYTKSGDKGKTSLGNGNRVLKSNLRIEAIGSLDEANCFIGQSVLSAQDTFKSLLLSIQNDLFDLGADLCMPNSEQNTLRVNDDNIAYLENKIDSINSDLSDLTSFILPGGTKSAADLHLARSVVRRAERSCVHLAQEDDINPLIPQYLNRLSDLLFVMARFENNKGQNDILWNPGGNK